MRIKSLGLVLLLLFTFFFNNKGIAQQQMERLDRGLVAVKIANGVFLSWRIFGYERTDVGFNIYRNGTKLNTDPVLVSNYLDASGTTQSYQVAAVVNGVEKEKSSLVSIWAQNYLDIPMQIPAGGTTPASEAYTYSSNDCSVGDLDGDGQYEIVVKWDPSNAHDNAQTGYTGPVILDAYKLNGTRLWRISLGINIRAGAHYTQFMVYDLDGDGKAEVACKTAPGTKDGSGSFLSNGPAASDNDAADYRATSGHITSGPEYLTLFNGLTGVEMATINYVPDREPANGWGDSDDYVNRVNRHLACIAYLDGYRPSLIMCRGYYARSVLVAYDWRNGVLTSRWTFDTNNGYAAFAYQGNHNLSVADVDNDGKDEIVYGSCTIDDNGTGKYSTGYGHGDAMHVGDFDYDRPGLEVWQVHEGGSYNGNVGGSFRDAKTGSLIWKFASSGDVGRGVAADIDATRSGAESWAAGSSLYSSKGTVIGSGPSTSNFRVYWDGDALDELLNGTTINKVSTSIFSPSGCSSNNGTKSTPGLSADLLGDWREEVIWRTSDNAYLRIYTTTTATNIRMYTLMHDRQYRLSVAWQNVAYNQPPHIGFSLADNPTAKPPSAFTLDNLYWKGDVASNIWDLSNSNWSKNNAPVSYKNGDSIIFDGNGVYSVPVTINTDVQPGFMMVNSASNYELNGTGGLTGTMMMVKAGNGMLTLRNKNAYTGITEVWDGSFIVNDTLTSSPVIVRGGVYGGVKAEGKEGGRIGGNGVIKVGLTLTEKGCLIPGGVYGVADTLTIETQLREKGIAINVFDLSDDPTGITKSNDFINVIGNLSFSDSVYFIINKLNTSLSPGDYALFHYTGSFTGNLNKITVIGIPGIKYTILDRNDTILLNVAAMRAASSIVWTGDINSTWDLATTANWLKGETPEIFVTGDTVRFIDNNPQYTTVVISGISPSIGSIIVDASTDFSFAGTGSLIGAGGITKTGSGKLYISNSNSFTGNVSFTGGSLEIASLANGGVASSIGAGSTASTSFKLADINVKFTGVSSSTNRGLTLVSDTISMEVGSGKTISVGGIIAGAGKLTKTGTGTLNLTATNTYTGGTIIKSGVILTSDIGNPLGSGLITLDGGTLTMGSSDAYTTFNSNFYVPNGSVGTLNTDLRCNYYGSLTGGGTLNVYLPGTIDRTIFGGNWSAFTGLINVSGTSRFRLATIDYVGPTINLASGVTMYHSTGTSGGDAVATTVNIGALSGVSGSYLIDENWVIGAKNVNTTFAGAISGNSLTKVGTGVLALSGINTYTGGTNINSGKILLSNSSNGFGTGLVNINNTAILTGTGSIKAPISVNSGGTIAAGNAFGSLLINNNVTFKSGSFMAVDVISSSNLSDKIFIVGSYKIVLNGTLQITEYTGAAFIASNSFTIISGSNITGNFTSIVPATPGDGLVWDTTSLCSSGIIKVIADTGVYAPQLANNVVNVKVYPNPARDYVYLETEKMYNKFSVRVLNALGLPENVFIKKLNTGAEVRLSSLPEGVYILQIVIDGKTIYKKIVKE